MRTYKHSPLTGLIEHVERLIHNNLVNDAFIIVAEFFENEQLVDVFDEISKEQAHMGYMTEDALARRNVFKLKLLEHIEAVCGTRVRKIFKSLI